ncbi:recombination protein RecR [Candidatus Microgenomates bacterium]|nr:recombination protein RecR [Candidatus Microgenomates bacterium]
MRIAKPLASLIESFESLPGIGPKSAQRLAYYLLHVPQTYLDDFSENLVRLKKDTVLCKVCKNVSETDPCPICEDSGRDMSVLLVVEQPLDLIAFERSGKFRGVYHVLHGAINPLDNIGPDEIFVDDLFKRLGEKSGIEEVIVATNPTMEGEATAMYINKKITESNKKNRITGKAVKVTRLGMGIPTGADLEYADDTTLTQALEGRREL